MDKYTCNVPLMFADRKDVNIVEITIDKINGKVSVDPS